MKECKIFRCKCGKIVAKIVVGSLIQKGAVIVCGECNKKPDLFNSIFGKIK